MPHLRGAAAVLALTLFGTLGAGHFWRPSLESFPVGVASADVPTLVAGDASHGDAPPGDYLMSALPGSKMLFRTYSHGANSIQFLLLSGTAGVALHDPRLCLSGFRLSAPRTVPVAGTPIVMQTYEGCTTTGLPDVSVAYFYVVNNQVISSSSRIRVAMLENALIGRQSTPVYFFRFIEPLSQDQATAARRQAHLQQFAAAMWHSRQPRIAPA